MPASVVQHHTVISPYGEYRGGGSDELVDLQTWSDRVPGSYVEGVVRLWINGKQLIDDGMWTDVESLWAYLVNVCEELLQSSRAEYFFPDAPIPIVLEKVGGRRIRMTIGKRSAIGPYPQVAIELCEGAAKVFDQLAKIRQDAGYLLAEAKHARDTAQSLSHLAR
jgi:hypothetical protein